MFVMGISLPIAKFGDHLNLTSVIILHEKKIGKP